MTGLPIVAGGLGQRDHHSHHGYTQHGNGLTPSVAAADGAANPSIAIPTMMLQM